MLKLLNDATFYHLLARIDADLAEAVRQAKCRVCGGVLHSARYPRKPRGGPADLPSGYDWRHSLCCAIDGCRKRTTPPSTRFLGRRVYLGAIVVLATAMRDGINAVRAARLKELFGVSRKTLDRWRAWWRETLPASRFWQSVRARLMPAIDEGSLPSSLLACFTSCDGDDGALVALLQLLRPITTTPGLEASAS
jgi:hypothetical protein